MAASPSPTFDEQFAIGSVLDGRYRIDAVLGTGGMGRVYRAEHTKIGKSVAIKVLHADLHRNREASQRFQREAIASGRLDHPNIVGVSDFGVLDDGACYLVMEVLEGESLGDRLARDKRIHWVEAIDILRGVLYGLRHAHERGVVHRDIKPDNVYLARKDGDPVIKILDFGIAKLYAGSEDDPASTRAGLTVGTPAYLSPEQAVGGEITPASDLYSASIVLYEMLAGRAPFEDKDPLAMLGAHVSRRPPPFADVAPGVDVPLALEDIIQRGLVKTAADRISTATDYLVMLDAFSPPLHMPRMVTAPVVSSPAEQLGTAVTSTAMSAVPAEHSAPVSSAPSSPPRSSSSSPPSASASARSSSPPGATPSATPMPGAAGSPAAPGSRELAPLPRAARAVALADAAEPIPLSWIVRSGVVIGLVIVVAIALAIAARCTASEPAPPASAEPITKPAPPAITKPTPPASAKPTPPAGAKSPPASDKPSPPEPPAAVAPAPRKQPPSRAPGDHRHQ
jgi:serine/threonine-protein kinase